MAPTHFTPVTPCPRHPERLVYRQWGDEWVCDMCYLVATGEALHPDLLGHPAQEQVAQFVIFTLNHLWWASPDSVTERRKKSHPGCCPICCTGCKIIGELLQIRELDNWVTILSTTARTTAWWNDEHQRVDRTWLAQAWSHTDEIGCAARHTEAQNNRLLGLHILCCASQETHQTGHNLQ